MPDILEGYREAKGISDLRRFRRLCHGYHGLKTYNLFRALSDSGLGAFTMGAEDTQALG